jgi:hypothetical protein
VADPLLGGEAVLRPTPTLAPDHRFLKLDKALTMPHIGCVTDTSIGVAEWTSTDTA